MAFSYHKQALYICTCTSHDQQPEVLNEQKPSCCFQLSAFVLLVLLEILVMSGFLLIIVVGYSSKWTTPDAYHVNIFFNKCNNILSALQKVILEKVLCVTCLCKCTCYMIKTY